MFLPQRFGEFLECQDVMSRPLKLHPLLASPQKYPSIFGPGLATVVRLGSGRTLIHIYPYCHEDHWLT